LLLSLSMLLAATPITVVVFPADAPAAREVMEALKVRFAEEQLPARHLSAQSPSDAARVAPAEGVWVLAAVSEWSLEVVEVQSRRRWRRAFELPQGAAARAEALALAAASSVRALLKGIAPPLPEVEPQPEPAPKVETPAPTPPAIAEPALPAATRRSVFTVSAGLMVDGFGPTLTPGAQLGAGWLFTQGRIELGVQLDGAYAAASQFSQPPGSFDVSRGLVGGGPVVQVHWGFARLGLHGSVLAEIMRRSVPALSGDFQPSPASTRATAALDATAHVSVWPWEHLGLELSAGVRARPAPPSWVLTNVDGTVSEELARARALAVLLQLGAVALF
jgi:hypothetical protein